MGPELSPPVRFRPGRGVEGVERGRRGRYQDEKALLHEEKAEGSEATGD